MKLKEEGKIGRKLSDHKLNRRSDAEWLHLKPLSEGETSLKKKLKVFTSPCFSVPPRHFLPFCPDVENCSASHVKSPNDTQLTEAKTPESPSSKTPQAASGEPKKAKHHGHSHSHGHSHGGNCHSDQDMKEAGIASIAWMVIMGDGMHNFSDGLAIGKTQGRVRAQKRRLDLLLRSSRHLKVSEVTLLKAVPARSRQRFHL